MFTQNDLALLQAALEFFRGNAPLDDEDIARCDNILDKLIGWNGENELLSIVKHIGEVFS